MSEIARPDLEGTPVAVVKYLEEVEALAGARTIGVSRNNRFPRWSFDRWVGVATLIGAVGGWVWFSGGEWREMKLAVGDLRKDVDSVIEKVDTHNEYAVDLQRQIDRMYSSSAGATPPRPTITPAAPAFSRDDQFEAR